jgi:hypothetical protein
VAHGAPFATTTDAKFIASAMKLKKRVAFMAGTNRREEETGVSLGSFHFSYPASHSSDEANSQHRGESSLGTDFNGRAGE